MSKERERKPTFDPEYIRDISVTVYCQRLVDNGGVGAADRMVEKDADGGEKLRGRAASYDALTRAYLKALGFEPPQRPAETEEVIPTSKWLDDPAVREALERRPAKHGSNEKDSENR